MPNVSFFYRDRSIPHFPCLQKQHSELNRSKNLINLQTTETETTYMVQHKEVSDSY